METKPNKAWMAGVGQTITALGTAWAAVETTLSDGFTFADAASIAVALIGFVGTIFGVWRVTNTPKE
jgi:hypothetical protein